MTADNQERESVVLRFCSAIQAIGPESLKKASLREGARILSMGQYGGVKLSLLDLSTTGTTKTFKDWLACVTIAYCLDKGIKTFVTQSSGNTGNALGEYARRHGIKMILLYPKFSRYKIDPAFVEGATVIECDTSEPEMKRLTDKLAKDYGIERLPTFEMQILANKLRAYFLFEHYEKTGEWFDWHSQALSSAYGIFGLYRGFEELGDKLSESGLRIPKFLGVQQEAVYPFVKAYRDLNGLSANTEYGGEMLEPTLFRTQPTPDMISEMNQIVEKSGGTLEILSNADFEAEKSKALDLVHGVGIEVGTCEDGRLLEHAGLISLLGALRAIDNAVVKAGESFLVAFTGGARKPGKPFLPKHTISAETADSDLEKVAIAAGIA